MSSLHRCMPILISIPICILSIPSPSALSPSLSPFLFALSPSRRVVVSWHTVAPIIASRCHVTSFRVVVAPCTISRSSSPFLFALSPFLFALSPFLFDPIVSSCHGIPLRLVPSHRGATSRRSESSLRRARRWCRLPVPSSSPPKSSLRRPCRQSALRPQLCRCRRVASLSESSFLPGLW